MSPEVERPDPVTMQQAARASFEASRLRPSPCRKRMDRRAGPAEHRHGEVQRSGLQREIGHQLPLVWAISPMDTFRPKRQKAAEGTSARSKEKRAMNNLHRELAPISDAAWAQIEEETKRTLKRISPDGAWSMSRAQAVPVFRRSEPATSRRSRRRARASSRDSARSSRWSNSAFPSSSTASRSTTSSAARTIPTGSRRRTPRRQSPMPRIAPSSKATQRLRLKASGRERAIRS